MHFYKGLLFSDVTKFRKAPWDFEIQKGFDIVKLKIEKLKVIYIGVTVNFGSYIHASLTPNGKTFKIKTSNSIHSCVKTTAN